jgi:hypothetical protein
VGKNVCWPLILGAVVGFTGATPAHYNMLLPASPSTKKGEPVMLVYQWGHPFEHQLFDAPKPQSLVVFTPDGKKIDLAKSLELGSETTADKKKVAIYQLKFTPEVRGDYVFLLQTPPIWMEEDQEFFHDTGRRFCTSRPNRTGISNRKRASSFSR